MTFKKQPSDLSTNHHPPSPVLQEKIIFLTFIDYYLPLPPPLNVSQFTDEETEVQGKKMTTPVSHSYREAKLGLESRSDYLFTTGSEALPPPPGQGQLQELRVREDKGHGACWGG